MSCMCALHNFPSARTLIFKDNLSPGTRKSLLECSNLHTQDNSKPWHSQESFNPRTTSANLVSTHILASHELLLYKPTLPESIGHAHVGCALLLCLVVCLTLLAFSFLLISLKHVYVIINIRCQAHTGIHVHAMYLSLIHVIHVYTLS